MYVAIYLSIYLYTNTYTYNVLPHLGRKVLRRSAKGRGDLVIGDQLSEPKIRNLAGGHALAVGQLLQQDVLRLEVAVLKQGRLQNIRHCHPTVRVE